VLVICKKDYSDLMYGPLFHKGEQYRVLEIVNDKDGTWFRLGKDIGNGWTSSKLFSLKKIEQKNYLYKYFIILSEERKKKLDKLKEIKDVNSQD
jgi:hypothetical protein